MNTAIRAGLLFIALILDSSSLLDFPVLGGIHPLLFIVLVSCFAMSAGAFTGGSWGFSGGLALGFLVGGREAGAMTLAGFLAGAVPVLLRPLVFRRRWTGQAALGFLSALLFNLVLLGVTSIHGEEVALSGGAWLGVLADSALTAVLCPVAARALRALERDN